MHRGDNRGDSLGAEVLRKGYGNLVKAASSELHEVDFPIPCVGAIDSGIHVSAEGEEGQVTSQEAVFLLEAGEEEAVWDGGGSLAWGGGFYVLDGIMVTRPVNRG